MQGEQQQYYQEPQVVMSGYPNQLTEGLLQYQLESNEVIDELECLFLGKIKVMDPKTNTITLVEDNHNTALINEKGMARIMTHLKSRLTKIYALSDFDEEIIGRMTIDVGDNVIDMIETHWDEFGIKSYSDASAVVRIVSDAVYSTLRKAHIGNYLKFLTTTSRIHETQQIGPSQMGGPMKKKDSSMLSRIFGGKI